jgi:uncharacterized membrane protein
MATVALPHDSAGRVPVAATAARRLDSVDLLRGFVMIVMALDHARDFMMAPAYPPENLAHTTPLLFFTRWITHFCAPTFVFLAGTGAFLSGRRGRPIGQLQRLLLTRGLWLVVLELTVVRFAWAFNFDYSFWVLQVIWVIGVSMIVLAALVRLPTAAIAAFGVGMIALHNLFDGIHVSGATAVGQSPGAALAATTLAGASARDWIVALLHEPKLPVLYPLVPWIGVMAAGYAFGPLLLRTERERRRALVRLGLGLTVAFVVLRLLNVYGDPSPWAHQRSAVFTVLSFLNTTKYPPSLLYLLMTLGPVIALLPLLERARGAIARIVTVYGRVPFLYYVAHLVLIHLASLAIGVAHGYPVRTFLVVWPFYPHEVGQSLGVAYLVWIGAVVALYPLCRWFAAVKASRRDWWLSYL